jgi:hypothetical protein
LDFFSWHRYASDPSDYARRACALRQLLDAHGFTKTESHFNEWNCLPNEDWRPMMKEGQGLMFVDCLGVRRLGLSCISWTAATTFS